MKDFFILCFNVCTKWFNTASHVADAHCTCKCISVYFSECLYLHCTWKWNNCVGKKIPFQRQETYHKKKNYFIENHKLPPMEFLNFTVFDVYEFREGNAKSKKYKRHQDNEVQDASSFLQCSGLTKQCFLSVHWQILFHGICMCMRPVDHLKLIKMQRLRMSQTSVVYFVFHFIFLRKVFFG